MHLLLKCRVRICLPRRVRFFSSTTPAYSLSFEAHSASLNTNGRGNRTQSVPRPKSFTDLGLHPPIVSALQAAFPSIRNPTKSQEILIPAVLGSSQDIFLRDETGSGKSFGLVLALLNRPRAGTRSKPTITSIFIVPHRDLAYQCQQWVEQMFALESVFSVNSISQVLVRDSRGSELSLLRENPPHLLFGTPQALMDAWRQDPGALQLDTISAVVVDEADYLIPTANYKMSRKPKMLKQQQHPSDTRQFLDIIYARKGTRTLNNDDEERDQGPQLIVSSATLSNHLVEYVSRESGWLARDNWVTVSGPSSSRSRPPEYQVTHSVLVVSEDHVRNIEGALSPSPSNIFTMPEGEEEVEDPVVELDSALEEKYSKIPSPFNPLAIETIATIFATQVPHIALLVIPSTSPVQRAIYELRALGVNATATLKDRLLSIPTLLVSTWANTRGLDVPELTHVFVLGVPAGGATTYVHIAGRVGRLENEKKRRKGQVVMVVEPSEEEAAKDLLRSIQKEAVALEILQ